MDLLLYGIAYNGFGRESQGHVQVHIIMYGVLAVLERQISSLFLVVPSIK